MSAKIISSSFDNILWNSKAVHPLQSWEWGEARKEMGIDVLRIGEYKKDVLKDVFQITFHNIPFTKFSIGYLPRSVIPSSETMYILIEEAKKRNSIFLKMEPYIIVNVVSNQRIKDDFLSLTKKVKLKSNSLHYILDAMKFESLNFKYLVNIIKSSHPLFPEWTQIIDLTQTDDNLIRRMKPKTRYNIKLAKKRGVVIKEETNNEGFNKFINLYFETCRRQHYKGHTVKYHKIVFEKMKKNISHILIAYYKNIPLVAYQLFIFNDVCYYVYGGSSNQYKNTMASNLLMWESILFAKKNGCKAFDMWGSLPPGYNDFLSPFKKNKWSGFTRFKEGYGGSFVEFIGSWDIILKPLAYKIYSLLYKVRKLFLSI